jgi:hypothetical protein
MSLVNDLASGLGIPAGAATLAVAMDNYLGCYCRRPEPDHRQTGTFPAKLPPSAGNSAPMQVARAAANG